MHKYSPEEIRFIEKSIAGRSYAEMTDLFNRHFGLRGKKKLTPGKMGYMLKKNKLSNGLPRRFQPGNTPHNKEKGNLKIGTERIIDGGWIQVKTAFPNVWKLKHRVLWEKTHGKIPNGYVILFADGNKINTRLDNLLMVSRKELYVMNRFGLIFTRRDLTKTGKMIADIKIRVNDLKRGEKNAGTKAKKTGRKKA
jgi:hypothetical protein